MPLPTHIGLNAMQCALLSHTCRRTRRETYFVLFELEQIQDSQSDCAAVLDSVLPWAWVFLNMAGRGTTVRTENKRKRKNTRQLWQKKGADDNRNSYQE